MGVVEGDIAIKRQRLRGKSGSGWLSGRKSKGWRDGRPKRAGNKGNQKP